MSDYVDGDLSPRERRRLERHTEICPECRRALRTLVVVVSELRRLRRNERGKVASQVVERLTGRLDEEPGARNGK
jgi:anti-sigma factor RsiW